MFKIEEYSQKEDHIIEHILVLAKLKKLVAMVSTEEEDVKISSLRFIIEYMREHTENHDRKFAELFLSKQ